MPENITPAPVMAEHDVTAPHEFTTAPDATHTFSDAVTNPSTQAPVEQGSVESSAAGSHQEALRNTPELTASDVTAPHVFAGAPDATHAFNDAVTRPEAAADAVQGEGQEEAQGGGGGAPRGIPDPAPHLRPDDKQLVKEVHEQVEELEGPSPW